MPKINTLSVWLHSIIAAAITGLATGVTVSIADPSHFNFSHDGLLATFRVSCVSAVLGVAAVLKQSPLPTANCADPTASASSK